MVARSFTKDELKLARALRRAKKSWRAIGRALGCSDETIRRHIDPSFDGAARSARIRAAERARAKVARTKVRRSEWYF
jgi:IS30 family transposase